jgi:hypothetical protein
MRSPPVQPPPLRDGGPLAAQGRRAARVAALRARRDRGRGRCAAGVALAAALGLYLVALAATSTDAAEGWVRTRLHAVLRARLGPVELGDEVRIDPLFRVWFGPLAILAPGEREPVLRAAQVTVRPSLPALLAGRIAPASIHLGDVHLRPGPGGRALRDVAERLGRGRGREDGGGSAAPGRTDLPSLRVRGLRVSLPGDGEEVVLGPFDGELRVDRDGDDRTVRLDARLPGGGRAWLDARRDAAGWHASASAERLGPDLLPEALRGPVAPAAGTASLQLEAEGPADLARLDGRVQLEVADLEVAGERVGPDPVGPLGGAGSATFTLDRPGRRLALRGDATLLGTVPVTFDGAVELGQPATFSLAVRAERVDWGAAVAALPPALALPEDAPQPDGTVDAHLEVAGPLHAPAQWQVRASLDLARLREASRRAGPVPLTGPFRHRPPLDGGGRGPELRIGPASPDFVPVAELPETTLRAVTAAEDGGFFGHPGFDFDELRNALAQGAERGRVVRGGSTITQQVAKNLFLGPERTLARKIREAAITVGLEATLPKRRILEIYLNVAEWGPGVWGIGPAARHWFGKDARALTTKEAAFLAAIIAMPTRAQPMLARGVPTEEGLARTEEVLVRMAEQRVLTGDALSQALEEPLVFARPRAEAPLLAPHAAAIEGGSGAAQP